MARRAGLHRGWSAPADGAYGQRPMSRGSSGAPGQAQRGQQGELNGSAEDPEPQHNHKWGPAHHWRVAPSAAGQRALKGLPVGAGVGGEGRRGARGRGGMGAAFCSEEGLGATGDMAPPTLAPSQPPRCAAYRGAHGG